MVVVGVDGVRLGRIIRGCEIRHSGPCFIGCLKLFGYSSIARPPSERSHFAIRGGRGSS